MIAYSTDAPIYHRPVATVGLIVIQCLLYLLVPKASKAPEPEMQMPAAGPRMIVPLGVDEPAERPQWDDTDFAEPEPGQDAIEEPGMELKPASPNPWPSIGQIFRTYQPRLQLGVLKPLQWITSPLIHIGLGPLIINMIGLWALGLVIEGKVGSQRFLLMFFLLAIPLAAVIQFFSWIAAADGRVLGGSEFAILGLLGVAIMWAPKNCFDVWFGPYIGSHEIPILIYGFIQAILSVFFLHSGSGLAALLSILAGASVGFLWLRRKWVDCEGWDLLSVWQNKHVDGKPTDRDEELDQEAQRLVEATRKYRETGIRRSSKTGSRRRTGKIQRSKAGDDNNQAAPDASSQSVTRKTYDEDLATLIDQQQYATALKLRTKLQQQGTPVQLPQPVLGQLMRGLLKSQQYSQAVEIMQEHIARFAESRSAVQLALCKTLLHMERPNRALKILRSMDRNQLDESEKSAWKRLASHAKQQIDDGVIELSD